MSALPEDPTPPEPEPTPEPEPEPTPEDEPEDAPVPEPTPEPTEPTEALSEKEISKRIDALEREKERHAKRIGEILQEEALDLMPCEACEVAIPGFHYPAQMYAPGSPERALYELLGGGTEAVYKHPDRYIMCETCNGHGQVLTGARNELNRLKACPDCGMSGYHDKSAPQAPVVTLTTATGTTYAATEAEPPAPQVDFLGRPVGHPNYGKMTTYLTPEEQAIDVRDGYALA